MLPASLRAVLGETGVVLPACRVVLLVDDEPGNLEVLRGLLEDDYEVRTAASGLEALALLAQTGPADLVISDQRMPGMTGIELLAEVARRHPATLRIVLTGYSDVEPMLEAANRGLVYRFLCKPFDPAELTGIVADALRTKACAAALLQLVVALDEQREALVVGAGQLRMAQEQLLAEERLNTLGRLVAQMAGELQSRSAGLSLLLGLVRQTVTDAQVLADAERVWAGLGSLRELLAQVRDYTRTTTSRPMLVPIHPRALLAQTMDLLLMEELGHRCPVSAEIDEHIGNLVVDATRLQQALLALLRNAARASAEGQPIAMAVRILPGGNVLIEVVDRGHGMTDEELLRAAEPFHSGFPTPGIGLGLEVARLGATAHGGGLALDSAPGQGTRARLLLPATVLEASRGT